MLQTEDILKAVQAGMSKRLYFQNFKLHLNILTSNLKKVVTKPKTLSAKLLAREKGVIYFNPLSFIN